MDDQQIGARLRLLRGVRGWKQAALARRCGWSAAKLSKLESGKQAMTVLELAQLAQALEVPLAYLAGSVAGDVVADQGRSLQIPVPLADQVICLLVTIRHDVLEVRVAEDRP